MIGIAILLSLLALAAAALAIAANLMLESRIDGLHRDLVDHFVSHSKCGLDELINRELDPTWQEFEQSKYDGGV